MSNEYGSHLPMIHTIKSSLIHTSERVTELEKKFNTKVQRFTDYTRATQLWKNKTDQELEKIGRKLDELNASLNKIEIYIKEKEIQKNVWSKIFDQVRKVPATFVAISAILGGFITWLTTNLNSIAP